MTTPPYGYDPQNPQTSENPENPENPEAPQGPQYPQNPENPRYPEQPPPSPAPDQGYPQQEYQPSSYPQQPSTQPEYPPQGYQQPGYQQQTYAQPGYPGQPGYPQPASPYGVPTQIPGQGGGLAIAALVFGIASILFAIFNICDLPIAIVGIVLGIFARSSPARRNLATVGLVLSIVGLVIALVILIAGLAAGNYHPPAGA